MTTSKELRERIVHWHEEMGMSVCEIAHLSGRCKKTIYNILNLHQRFGTIVNPLARTLGRRRLFDMNDMDYLASLLAARPAIFLDEIQEELKVHLDLDVSLSTISRALVSIAVTRKGVSKEAAERDEMLRAIWQAEIGMHNNNRLVFIDEAGVDDHTNNRRMGRAPMGRACVRRSAFIRGQKYSILPALSLQGMIALDIFEGSVNRARFTHFLREHLVCTFNSSISVMAC